MGLIFESVTYDLLLLAASLAIFVFTRVMKRLRTFEEAGIPYLAKTMFENNLFADFTEESLGRTYDRLAPHKYGGMFHFLVPCLLVRDPATVDRLLTTDFSHFNDHAIPVDEETNPNEDNVFFLSGPKWKALRRKLAPTFTSGKLKRMFPLIGDCADDLIAKISEEGQGGRDLEMTDLLARFTTDVIGSCAFGLEPESIKNPKSKFRTIGNKLIYPTLFVKLAAVTRLMFPSFFKFFRIPTHPREVTQFFGSLVPQTISHRMSTGEKRDDFVQLLVQLKEKGFVEQDTTNFELEEPREDPEDHEPPAKIEFTDQMLTAQAFIFFLAGFETTASTIGFTLYLLAKETEAQERARKEVKEAAGGKITYETVTGMTYLNACIKEALRLYPPFLRIPRLCTKDYVMEDGKKIKKGMTLVIPSYSIHRDPDYYPSPLEFRPERFMEGETQVPGSYLPFGHGPRTCIARRFALLEVATAVAKILNDFNIALSPKMESPLKMKVLAIILKISPGLWLQFEKIDK